MAGGTGDEDRPALQAQGRGSKRKQAKFPWPEGADLETGIAMGLALLSGRSEFVFAKFFGCVVLISVYPRP